MPPRKIKSNWILAYSEAIDKFSEAPVAFNIWAALSVISAVLKNNVYINRGTFKIYPNQYIVLVSPPGIGKGTAIHPAHAFIKEHTPALANYLSDRITAPRIVEKLAQGFPGVPTINNGVLSVKQDSSAIIQATELSTFLGSSDWMPGFLCDTWDRGEFEYDTKGKGTHLVRNMCVSLIGACVPDFIRDLNKDSGKAISGGFTARTLFIFANEKSKSIVWPQGFDSTAEGKKLKQDLADDLEAIARLNGEFKWTNTAKVMFERAYSAIKSTEDDTDVVRHFKARQPVHIMKLAMCFSAATNDSLIIDDYCINTAIALIDAVLKTLDITFRGVGTNPFAEITAKILSYIERKGTVARTVLIHDNWRHATIDVIEQILVTLLSMSCIQEVTIGKARGYKYTGPKSSTNGHGKVSIK